MHLELESRPVQIIKGHVIYNSPYKYWPDENSQCLLASIERDFFYPLKKLQIVEKANMVKQLAGQVCIWKKKTTDEKISHEIRLFW